MSKQNDFPSSMKSSKSGPSKEHQAKLGAKAIRMFGGAMDNVVA